MNIPCSSLGKLAVCAAVAIAASPFARGNNEQLSSARAAFASRPLEFIENRGQFDERALFRVDGSSLGVFVTNDGFNVSMRGEDPTRGASVHVRFEGARVPSSVVAARPTGTERNWLVGAREHWVSGVRSFGEVTLIDVYPGIDVRFYASGSSLEYDFVLAPGADASRIVVRVDGADKLEVAADGSLVAQTAAGPLTQHVPATYAITQNGARRDVACQARLLDDRRFAFDVEGRSAHERLVIDPVLTASNMLCGGNDDKINAVSVSDDDSVFVAGTTQSSLFLVTTGAWDSTFAGTQEAFAAKLSPDLTQLVWCTYIGSNGKDQGNGIDVNTYGEACIVGRIEAGTAPTPWVAWPSGGTQLVAGDGDAFVAHLYADGKTLFMGGLFAGSNTDKATSITWINPTTFAFTGTTHSLDFMNSPNAYGQDDVFVVRIDENTPNDLSQRRVIGGNGDDEASSIVPRLGKFYVCGKTHSTNIAQFAMPGGPVGYDLTLGGFEDGFVIALASNLSTDWFTYVGGSSDDECVGVGTNGQGQVFVAGETASTDFPKTAGAFAAPNLGLLDVYLMRLDANGTQLGFSSVFGGSGKDNAGGLVVDGNAYPWVIGQTESTNFPTTASAWSTTSKGGSDIFATRFTPDGTMIEFSTYLGGAADEDGNAVTSVNSSTVVVAGTTKSTDYPRTAEGTPSFLESGSNGCVSVLKSPDCQSVKFASKYGAGTKGWQALTPKLAFKHLAFDGLSITDITPGGFGYIAVGTQTASVPYQGGTMLVANPWLVPIGTINATSTIVPFVPTKYGSISCGLTLHYQVLLYVNGTATQKPAMTNGLSVTFGS